MSRRKSKQSSLLSRSCLRAGRLQLDAAQYEGALSFGSQITHGSRWKCSLEDMGEFARVDLKAITRDQVIAFGKRKAAMVEDDLMSPHYAQNLVSSFNTVMHLMQPGMWLSVSPTKECGIPKRINCRQSIPDGMDDGLVRIAIDALCAAGESRFAAVVGLIDSLGLRVREASLLDARKALDEAIRTGKITVRRGTKGGQHRIVPASCEAAIAALTFAAKEQGERESLIPAEQSFEQFLDGEIQRGRPILKACGIKCPRELRAGWAVRRYRELAGFWPPLISGCCAPDKALDREARLQLSEELGHHRAEVTNSYIGGKAP